MLGFVDSFVLTVHVVLHWVVLGTLFGASVYVTGTLQPCGAQVDARVVSGVSPTLIESFPRAQHARRRKWFPNQNLATWPTPDSQQAQRAQQGGARIVELPPPVGQRQALEQFHEETRQKRRIRAAGRVRRLQCCFLLSHHEVKWSLSGIRMRTTTYHTLSFELALANFPLDCPWHVFYALHFNGLGR
eukprot:3366939-Amphidinium_carterae.1